MTASKQGISLIQTSQPLRGLPACAASWRRPAACVPATCAAIPVPPQAPAPPPYSVTPGTPPAASSAALAPTGGGGAVCSTAWSGRAICSRRVGLTCSQIPSQCLFAGQSV